jgi:hypothetical protein
MRMLRLVTAAVASLSFLAGLPTAKAGQSHPETCNVVQAAFKAATNNQDRAYPVEMRSSSRPMGRLESFKTAYVAAMSVGKDEWSDLISQQDKYSIEHPPVCDRSGRPQVMLLGLDRRIEVSSPIFSSDSKLAIIELSFRSGASMRGYGVICVARKKDSDWVARCIPSWIS